MQKNMKIQKINYCDKINKIKVKYNQVKLNKKIPKIG